MSNVDINKDGEMTYQQALDRINNLVAEIEDPNLPIEAILEKVKESSKLIEFCRNSLKNSQQEVIDAMRD